MGLSKFKHGVWLCMLTTLMLLISCTNQQKRTQGAKELISLDSTGQSSVPGRDSFKIEAISIDTTSVDTCVAVKNVSIDSVHIDDDWKSIYYGESWFCQNDTLFHLINDDFFFYPFGEFKTPQSLEQSIFFRDKHQYQEKIGMKPDKSDYVDTLMAYSVGKSRVAFCYWIPPPLPLDGLEKYCVNLRYADISDRNFVFDHNIHVGMPKNKLVNKFVPLDSVECEYSKLALANPSGSHDQIIFTFSDDTLSHIKLRSKTTIDEEFYDVFPWYEALENLFGGPIELY